jgi:hypothetical protein
MYRLLLFMLHVSWRRACLLGLCWLVPFIIVNHAANSRSHWVALLGLATLPLLFWKHWVLLLRFGKATWRFETVEGKHTVLRHAPDLAASIDLPSFVERTEQTLAEFSRQFGAPLKQRLGIFLFGSSGEVSRFFGMSMGGCAFPGGDAVVVAGDRSSRCTLDEIVRHELAHLFSAR